MEIYETEHGRTSDRAQAETTGRSLSLSAPQEGRGELQMLLRARLAGWNNPPRAVPWIHSSFKVVDRCLQS